MAITVGKHDTSLRYKELTFPAAVAMAELELLRNDLTTALNSITLLTAHKPGDTADIKTKTLVEALNRNANILWVSCFDHPQNGDLSPDEIYGPLDGALEFFKTAKAVRDSFAAHRFGPQRHTKTIAGLKDGKLAATDFVTMRYMSPGTEETGNMVRLIRVAIEAVEGKMRPLRASVAATLASMSDEELAALPDLRHTVPELEHVRMSREKFRSLRNGGK